MTTCVRLNSRLDSSAALLSHQLVDLFSGFLRPVPGEARNAVARIKIEVSENAAAYRVSAVIPGAKKEDIQIEVDQKEVAIMAEIKRENVANDASAEGGRVLHSERFYGKTSRAFSLPQDIDEASVEARYADGLMSLVLPKKVPVSAKRVAVQ